MAHYPGEPAAPASSTDLQLGRFSFRLAYRHAGGDEGITIHVFGPRGSATEEVLRFDCFTRQPHYHLGWSYRDAPFVPIEAPDPFDWALNQLQHHLPELLLRAEAEPLADTEGDSLEPIIRQMRSLGASLQPESLSGYIRLLENMRMPTPLTADLELDEHQQAVVESVARDVREEGFSIVEGFLEPAELQRLRAELEPIFALTGNRQVQEGKRGWPGTQTVHIPNLFALTRAVDALAIHPLLLSLVEAVLGPSFQMSVAVAMCPGPGADRQGLHQDDGHYPVPRPHVPLVANTLIALDNFSTENGATMLVPGSHKLAEPVDAKAATVRAEMSAGSLLIWDGAVWHAGGENHSADLRRRSINLNFNLSWLRQQENQYIGVPRKVVLAMPERLQRLLGYNKVNHLCGGVAYQDPLDYFRHH